MITNISLMSVWVKDIDESLAFYTDVLGFEVGDDLQLGPDFRWCTVFHSQRPPPRLPHRGDEARTGRGRPARHRDERRRLPRDLPGPQGQGRGVPAGAGGAALRRRGTDARQLRQLDGAGREAGLRPGGLRRGRHGLTPGARPAYRGWMRSWLITVGALLLALVLLRLACAALRGDLAEWRSARAAARRARRARRRGADVVPLHRPVERVGADLRRLHSTFHRGGMRFAKYEGCRLAYDRVLGEAADMAGCPHLLAVLPPGEELDHERQRVEGLLVQHGLLPPPYAA